MMAKEIQKLMIEKEINKGQMASLCSWSPSNLYNKMKRDNFSEEELRIMAEALECELKIEFIPKESANQ